MEPCAFKAELTELLDGMDPARRRWAVSQIRELLVDVRADQLLAEALGDGYTPMDPRDWRPSCPPPAQS